MSYIYETHLHSCVASACGRSEPEEYIPYYKKLGYSGIFVTDHFFNGNTCIPDTLPWEERVNRYCLSYERAKAEGDKQAFPFSLDGNAALMVMNFWYTVWTRHGCLLILK